jgi:hypothetical protein
LCKRSVCWRLLFRVKTKEKASQKLEEVRQTFGRELEVLTNERYWKDPTLWDCSITTPAAGSSPAEIAFDCLVLAARLGNGWYLLGPGGGGDLQVFSGVFNAPPRGSGTCYIKGLDWASFDLLAPGV